MMGSEESKHASQVRLGELHAALQLLYETHGPRDLLWSLAVVLEDAVDADAAPEAERPAHNRACGWLLAAVQELDVARGAKPTGLDEAMLAMLARRSIA